MYQRNTAEILVANEIGEVVTPTSVLNKALEGIVMRVIIINLIYLILLPVATLITVCVCVCV